MATGVSAEKYDRIFEGGFMQSDGKSLQVRLETRDLELRSVREEDKLHYSALYSHPETMRMFVDNEEFIAKNGVEKWQERQMTNVAKRIDTWIQRWKDGIPFSAFAIYHNGEFVGHIVAGMGDKGGESEIAYIIHKRHWNQGFATQAVEMVVQKWLPYLRQQGKKTEGDDGESQVVSVIVATSRKDNEWSNQILRNNGFIKGADKEAWGCIRNAYTKNI